jgi:hypothetical protein
MARAYPAEFRNDVVAVSWKHEAPISQIAKVFVISDATLHNWLKHMPISKTVCETARSWPSRIANANSAGASRPSNKRTRIFVEPPPTSPRSSPQNEIPAGP